MEGICEERYVEEALYDSMSLEEETNPLEVADSEVLSTNSCM